MIFDLIASQYGYTFKEIGQMTFKQVFIAFTQIMKRKKEEIKLQAKMIGAEIKDDIIYEGAKGLTKDQEDMIQRAVKEKMNQKGLKCLK